ncbi:hypothetical protein DSO57_1022570 [Entomophthora muscae]|uniref:Uncharacterized protein n=1 Tax=Entomophthora muscae TaxID=34485 RepID=A0ACC2U1H5_9FUNG|nr:hypothetical protein DSO57_1022570 [Entomophthora muscae]
MSKLPQKALLITGSSYGFFTTPIKEKVTVQNPPTFAHVLNQATSQENWKTYFCAHNIEKYIPSGCTVFKGLVMPKACAKIIQYSHSLQPQTNTQPLITGEVTNTKYIGIEKFFGENKENVINWLDHSANKICASCIPHKKWVQEASNCLYKAQPTGFPPGLAHKPTTSLTTGKSSKRTSHTISASLNPSKTLQYSSAIFLRRPLFSGIQSWVASPLFSGVTWAGFFAGNAHHKRGANFKR